MKRIAYTLAALATAIVLVLASCNKEEEVLPRVGLAKDYLAVRLEPLTFECQLEGDSYRWEEQSYIPEGEAAPKELNTTISKKKKVVAVFDHVGIYSMNFYYNEGKEDAIKLSFKVKVEREPTPYSAYISDVLEYKPAPGYFVNPRIKGIKTFDEKLVMRQCRSILIREDLKEGETFNPAELGDKDENFVSLGAFGGYIVFAFDHMVLNQKDPEDEAAECNDFIIYGRSYPGMQDIPCYNPGIVYVAYDRNGNGRPDDEEWCQLQGEIPQDQLTQTDITYTFNGGTPVVAGSKEALQGFQLVDHIFTDLGNLASANKEISYWPYVETPIRDAVDPISFSGLRMPGQGIEETGATKEDIKVTWKALKGYADAQPYEQNKGLDISKAIDKDGKPVDLPGIHFVRVQTGMFQQFGSDYGLCETKIMGAADLKLLPVDKRPQ